MAARLAMTDHTAFKLHCFNSNESTLTLEKYEGLYQDRVTCSLASILRPGNLATPVQWSILQVSCARN